MLGTHSLVPMTAFFPGHGVGDGGSPVRRQAVSQHPNVVARFACLHACRVPMFYHAMTWKDCQIPAVSWCLPRGSSAHLLHNHHVSVLPGHCLGRPVPKPTVSWGCQFTAGRPVSTHAVSGSTTFGPVHSHSHTCCVCLCGHAI